MNLPSIEKNLIAKRKELTDRIEAIDQDFRSGHSADSEERATEMENESVLTGLYQEANEELLLVNQALRRLKNGQYGTCSVCGEMINHDRLEALPHITECINCAKQEKR